MIFGEAQIVLSAGIVIGLSGFALGLLAAYFGGGKRRQSLDPNWYADGGPGTREQWRQRAYEVEDRLDRLERALFGDDSTCSCGAPRINKHWCSGGHYREHWGTTSDQGDRVSACKPDPNGNADWLRCHRGTIGCPHIHDGLTPHCIQCALGGPCEWGHEPPALEQSQEEYYRDHPDIKEQHARIRSTA